MENQTNEETDSPKKLFDLYLHLVENNNPEVRFYLADNVVLDWFGQTVKESKKVTLFIKEQVCKVTHHITKTYPSTNVAFRDTHNVKVPKAENVAIFPLTPRDEDVRTPPKQKTSEKRTEKGENEGVHNRRNPSTSPAKKMKFESDDANIEVVECETETSTRLKYVTAEGTVEFRKPSGKKMQSETKWERPVKLHLGYTSSSIKDCNIYLIIYEGNLKCRRNLFKEFCESECSTNTSV